MAGTEEIRGGGLHQSNLTVEKAQATWPHQKPEVAFIAHRLLLDHTLKSFFMGKRGEEIINHMTSSF